MSSIMNFSSFMKVNENIQKAKSILASKQIDTNDKDFIEICQWFKKTPGYIGLFTKFRFEENIEMKDLFNLHQQLIELNNLLRELPKPVIQFNSYEELTDAIRDIRSYQKAKSFFNAMLADQKKQYREADNSVKRTIDALALDLSKLSKEEQYIFIKKIARYNNLSQLIDSLKAFLDHDFNYDLIKAKIIATPDAEIVYDNTERELIIARISSYPASRKLLSDTSWCIATSLSNWNTYVGEDTFNVQYSIWDFSLSFTNIHSRVGITINQEGDVLRKNNGYAAHYKDDTRIEDLEEYIEDYDIPFSVLKPMSKEEIDRHMGNSSLRDEFNDAYISYDIDKIFSLFRQGLNPFYRDNIIMNKVLLKEDLESFKILIDEFGYPLDGAVESNNEYLNYIDFVASKASNRRLDRNELFDFVSGLVEIGCPIKNKGYLEKYCYTNDDVDLYKFLTTKGYRITSGEVDMFVKYEANKIFQYVIEKEPKFFVGLDESLQKELLEGLYSNAKITNKSKQDIETDSDLEFAHFFVDNIKLDANVALAFMPIAITMCDHKFIEKLVSVAGVINGEFSHYTPFSFAVEKYDDKNTLYKESYKKIALELFNKGGMPNNEDSIDVIKALLFLLEFKEEHLFEEYIKRGGDITADNNELMRKLVIANDIENIKYVLSLGAKFNKYMYDVAIQRRGEGTEFVKPILELMIDNNTDIASKGNFFNYLKEQNDISLAEKICTTYTGSIEIFDDTAFNYFVGLLCENGKGLLLIDFIAKKNLDLSVVSNKFTLYNIVILQYEQENKIGFFDYSDLIIYMIKNNAVIDTTYSPLVAAVDNNDLKLTKLLIENGLDPIYVSLNTVLYNGYDEIFELLVQNGLNDEDCFGYGGLKSAARYGHIGIFKIAVKYKLNFLLTHELLQSYINEAALNKQDKMVEYLESLGADINSYSFKKHSYSSEAYGSVLSNAILSGSLELVKYLISKGAYYKNRTVVDSNKNETFVSFFELAIQNPDKKASFDDKLSIVKYFVEDLKTQVVYDDILIGIYNGKMLEYLFNHFKGELSEKEIFVLFKKAAVYGVGDTSLNVLFAKYPNIDTEQLNEIGVMAATNRWNVVDGQLEKVRCLVEEHGLDPIHVYDVLKTGKNLNDDIREYLKTVVVEKRKIVKQQERQSIKT